MVRTPRDYQEDAINSFFDYFNKGNKGNPIISAATGCHAIDTEILMFDGSIKKVQDVVLGDKLMGDDYTARTVLKLKRGRELMYRIMPIKGESFVVNENHILSLEHFIKNEIKNITVADYLKQDDRFKENWGLYKKLIKDEQNNVIPLCDPIFYKINKIEPLEVDNYYGFTLDKNHLYMTADFFVHHNSGKSLIIAELIKRIIQMYPNQRIIMATHNSDLISQNAKAFLGQYPNADLGIYSAGLKKKQPWCQIVYGGIQTMYKYAEKLGHRDLMFIDETHLLAPHDDGMYMKFIADLMRINPYLKVVGLSATPWRSKGGSLTKQKNAIFTDIIYDISLGFLIKEGYLTPIAGKSSIIQADLSGVGKIGGEFKIGEMEKAFDVDELTKAAIDEVEVLAKDRKHFLFFTTGIQHAKNVEAELKSRGWDCDIVIGSTCQKTRDKYLDKFRKTKTRYALINNTVLTTGTDLPNCDCIVLLRGTQSSSLFIQIAGRGTRTMYAEGFDLNTKQGRLDAIRYGQKPNCIAEGQRVLTDRGLIPIELVTKDMKLWDGVEYVTHDGLVYKGECDIIEYAGLKATKEHKVWTKYGWKTIEECASKQIPISVTANGRTKIKLADNKFRSSSPSRRKRKVAESSLHGNDLHNVREGGYKISMQFTKRHRWLSKMWAEKKCVKTSFGRAEVVVDSMCCCKTKVQKPKRSRIQRLWRTRNRVQIQKRQCDGSIYNGQFKARPKIANRSNRQRWTLRSWKSKNGTVKNKRKQPTDKQWNSVDSFIQNRTSRNKICRRNTSRLFSERNDLRRSDRSLLQSKVKQTKGRVWDILNAGSRNRFTCEGLLVSNCLMLDYGGNVERFGAIDLIEAPFTYDKKPKDGDSDAPTAIPQKICPSCREATPISTRQCHCGFEFPFGDNVKHEACATNLAVISTEIKPVERNVHNTQYVSHVSKKGNPCLRVQYYDMLGHIASEYIMFGSFGEPRRTAMEWFYNAVDPEHYDKLPPSTEAALAIKHLFKSPKSILLKKSGRYFEVVERNY